MIALVRLGTSGRSLVRSLVGRAKCLRRSNERSEWAAIKLNRIKTHIYLLDQITVQLTWRRIGNKQRVPIFMQKKGRAKTQALPFSLCNYRSGPVLIFTCRSR
jgi:hypothetical protein